MLLPVFNRSTGTGFACQPLRFAGKPGPKLDAELRRNERVWDENFQAWDRIVGEGGNQFHQLFLYPAVKDFVGSVDGKDVLDLGCGEGAFCRDFAKTAKSVTGVDLSRDMLKAARKKERQNIRYQHGSFTSLPGIKDNSHDLVFSNMAFMSSPGMAEAFQEAYRVLRPGGQFVFVIKHPFMLWEQHKAAVPGAGYFDETSFEHKTPLARYTDTPEGASPSEITSVHYPRTVSTYLNGLTEAGFRLDAMNEPRPSTEAMRQFPDLQALGQRPSILMIRAIKPKLSTVG